MVLYYICIKDLGSEREKQRDGRGEYLHQSSMNLSQRPWRWATMWAWWVRVVAVDFPWPSANPRSVGSVGGAIGNTVNLIAYAPAPTSVCIALPQGPTNHISVGRPRSGRERGYRSTVGHDWSRDQPNTRVYSFFHAKPTKGIEFPLLWNNRNGYNQVFSYFKRKAYVAYC
jgi:hypothetical protein